jgi:hypothetical protein
MTWMLVSFTDFVEGNLSLPGAFEPVNLRIAFHEVFLAHPTVDTLAPQVKRLALELTPHEFDYLGFRQSELQFNGFKRGTVFPRHLNDPIDLNIRQHTP